MFARLLSPLLLVLSLLATHTAHAAEPTHFLTVSPPALPAKAYVLMDADSGQVLAEKNMHLRLPPASLTKLMTLYVASCGLKSQQIHLEDPVLVSRTAWQRGGSRMFLKVGSRVPLREIIAGIIVASGNDACVALAEHTAGSEAAFAQLMNAAAGRIGMTESHFVDSTGLPAPNHYGTAYDFARLTQAIINDFPEYYEWYGQKWITHNQIKQPNRNRLLWRDPSVDGLKTGHTDAAGYCLISSAKRSNMRLISVVLGASSDQARTQQSQTLLNFGFHQYKTSALYAANTPVQTARTYLLKHKQQAFGLTAPLFLTQPRHAGSRVVVQTTLPKRITTPVQKGKSYGELTVLVDNKPVLTRPLVALSDNPQAGFFSRLMGHIQLWFHR